MVPRLLARAPVRLLVELVAIVGLVVALHLLTRSSLLLAALTVVLAPAAYCGLVRLIERRPVFELALAGAPGELGVGLLLGAVVFCVTIGLIAALGGYSVAGVRDAAALLQPIPLALSSGVGEEILLRGVVFRQLEEWVGRWAALAISAALFGVMHLGNAHATLWAALAIALEAGVLLAAAYMTTRRLWLPIGMHIAWNWTQAAVFGAPVSGVKMSGYLRGDLHGPDWLTGGAFGPEASVVAVVVCSAVSVALLARARRPVSS